VITSPARRGARSVTRMGWRLGGALVRYRSEVDAVYPQRDKRSDGTVGDLAHRAEGSASEHNPDPDSTVDAWDMDTNLRTDHDPAAIEHLKRQFQAHPAAQLWIHNRQIADRRRGWKREPYYGPNPHDSHIHWEANDQHQDSQQPWGVAMLDDADRRAIRQEARAGFLGAEIGRGTGIDTGEALHEIRTRLAATEKKVDHLAELLTAALARK